MSFLGIGFIGEDLEESRQTVTALQKQVKSLNRLNDELRDRLEDMKHESNRSHELDLRRESESNEDEVNRVIREYDEMLLKMRNEYDSAKREMKREHAKALDSVNAEIATLKSTIRELELAAEEASLDVDLQVQEGVLEYKEAHLSDVNELNVKIAQLQGDIKAAKAEGDARGIVIKALESQVEDGRNDVESMMEFATEVAPKVNLDKFNINVEVPAPVTVMQKGGDNQKKQ